MGRLLGVGPGGECFVVALADWHGVFAFGDGPRAPGHVAGVESFVAVRHFCFDYFGYVPYPVGGY